MCAYDCTDAFLFVGVCNATTSPQVLATVGDAFVAGDEARLRLYCLVNSEYVEVIFRMRFLFASDLPAGQRGATTGARGGAGRNVSGGFGTDRASGLVRDRDDGPDPSRPLWTAADYSQVFFTGRDATRFATWRVAPADSRRPAQPGRGANFVDEDARRAVAEACALAEPSLPSAFEPAAVDLEREAKRLEVGCSLLHFQDPLFALPSILVPSRSLLRQLTASRHHTPLPPCLTPHCCRAGPSSGG